MIVNDSHSTPSSGTFITACPYFSFYISIIISWQSIQFNIFKLNFIKFLKFYSRQFYTFLISFHHSRKKASIYRLYIYQPIIIANILYNGLITSPKNPMEYLELIFVSINFEGTILRTIISYIFTLLHYQYKLCHDLLANWQKHVSKNIFQQC